MGRRLTASEVGELVLALEQEAVRRGAARDLAPEQAEVLVQRALGIAAHRPALCVRGSIAFIRDCSNDRYGGSGDGGLCSLADLDD